MTMFSNESERNRSPQTTEDFDFNQDGKPTKAIIGLVVLVVMGLALAFYKPASDNVAQSPSLQQDRGSAMTQMNRDAGQTTGQSRTN